MTFEIFRIDDVKVFMFICAIITLGFEIALLVTSHFTKRKKNVQGGKNWPFINLSFSLSLVSLFQHRPKIKLILNRKANLNVFFLLDHRNRLRFTTIINYDISVSYKLF